jgi:hypothetical protein
MYGFGTWQSVTLITVHRVVSQRWNPLRHNRLQIALSKRIGQKITRERTDIGTCAPSHPWWGELEQTRDMCVSTWEVWACEDVG